MQFFVFLLALVSGLAHANNDVDWAREARELLRAQSNVGNGYTTRCWRVSQGKGKPPTQECRQVEWHNVLLAIKQPLMPFKLVKARLTQGQKDECVSLENDFEISCALNHLGQANGLNTCFTVRPYGYKVYAIRRLSRGGEGVYSPYCDELSTPIVVHEGKKYLHRVIDQAYEELRVKQVKSLAFPDKLVTDVISKDVVHNIALIEHIDDYRLRQEGIESLIDVVYATLGLNREKAYNLAPSSAGAGGLHQFMPKTYASMVNRYPGAGLIVHFGQGVADHVNATKATFVLMDHDLSRLTVKERETVLSNREVARGFFASTHNGGPSCPKNAYRNFTCAAEMFRKSGEFVKSNPSPENRAYVEKMHAVAHATRRML